MTIEEQEMAQKRLNKRVAAGVAAYTAVFDSWHGLDASTLMAARRAAIAAAICAADNA